MYICMLDIVQSTIKRCEISDEVGALSALKDIDHNYQQYTSIRNVPAKLVEAKRGEVGEEWCVLKIMRVEGSLRAGEATQSLL
jgi:hypothetical protein